MIKAKSQQHRQTFNDPLYGRTCFVTARAIHYFPPITVKWGYVRLGWFRPAWSNHFHPIRVDQLICDINTAVQFYNSCLFVVQTARYWFPLAHDVRVRASVSRRRTKWPSGNFYSFSECRLIESWHCYGHASDAGDPPCAWTRNACVLMTAG